ncbi:hypothetical protein ABZP36_034548 [Zizania latifolia]
MKKALHSMVAAILLLHLLHAAATTTASPTTGGLFHHDDGNAIAAAAAAMSSRRLLLPRTAAAAMATSTFHVKGVHQAPANARPKVEFDATSIPGITRSRPACTFSFVLPSILASKILQIRIVFPHLVDNSNSALV